jgi:SAM-dependent methyltransferase
MFHRIDNIPTHCNLLFSSRKEALSVSRGNLHLGFCDVCAHIYNYAFDAHLMTYSQAYENSLHFSSRFQEYARELMNDLIVRHDVHNKHIIELGCGKGEFLKMICEMGNNHGVGFDTSFQPELIEQDERFTVIQDFYSASYAHLPADLVVCRHVLEHIETPRTFVEQVHRTLADKSNAVLYVEVPNALWTLRDFGIWDLLYEHCSYFTPDSLSHLFSSSGFEVLRLEEKFGGQFLGIEVRPHATASRHAEQSRGVPVEHAAPLLQSFGEHYRRKIEEWKSRFREFESKRVVVWGSGSKGVTFVNALRPNIEYVVDINPRKHGKFVAGTGQEIVPPQFLRDYQPDAIIVMNPLYHDEIRGIASEMGIAAQVILA